MSKPLQLPARSEVPIEQTWDLESIFPTLQAWETAYQELIAILPSVSAYQGRLSEGPEILLEFLDRFATGGTLAGKLYTYASNSAAVDATDQGATARAGQARSLYTRFAAAVAFLDPELVAIGFDQLKSWIASTPALAYFAHYVDRLERQHAHVRSGEVEELLAQVADPFATANSAYGMLSNADLAFEPATTRDGDQLEVGQSSITGLLTHPDREVRRSAFQHYADAYLNHKNTFAATLAATVKQDVFRMRARRYSSSLQAALAPEFIPVEVFHNLIDVFQRHLPTWHRYWGLRKRALGCEEFHVYDIKAPLTTNKPQVSFQQAVAWITAGMAPMGEEYVQALQRGCLEERWVDWAINRGKRQGAFSSGTYGTRPFIMMSFAQDLFSLSTLAHELGHSMHTYYSFKTQPYLYSDYSIFVAEVASNFNQAMVRNYLFRTQTDPAFQIALIEEAMSNYHRYFFIMPTLARFEYEMHTRLEQGQPVNAEILIDLMADLFKDGYGDEVVFDRDRIGITWAQFGHLYANFYVYQYATGISGAHALAHAVEQGEPGAAERYLQFLKSGGAQYPLDALRQAGVDLTRPEPVERAFGVLADLVDRLAGLLEL